jgi:hypothetical protein
MIFLIMSIFLNRDAIAYRKKLVRYTTSTRVRRIKPLNNAAHRQISSPQRLGGPGLAATPEGPEEPP